MRYWILIFSLISSSVLQAIEIDDTQFNQKDGFDLVTREDGLLFSRDTPEGKAYVDLVIKYEPDGRRLTPIIRQLGMGRGAVMENLDPQYLFWVGDRDLEKRPDGWMIFFDRVPTRPYSVEQGQLRPKNITVSSSEHRATIELDGLKSSSFSGSLAFHFYDGSPFIHMEARVSTQRPATAFLYHTGLSVADTEGLRLNWYDSQDDPKSKSVDQDSAQVYQTRYRSIGLGSGNGSVVISPLPHQFLYPLDFVENYGYNWAGREYLDMIDGFSFGIRQPPIGDRRYVPWVNAPPGTEQKLGVFLFLSKNSCHQNLDTVQKYTRNDTFKPLPDYKTFTSHYHVEHSLDYMAKQEEQKTEDIPAGLLNPEFVDFFKRMGVD
ncbi:MAG: hypothetical protein KJT03_20825, partial [Verrucomicrobiae bacterium]|nr:hypothetical protein [Verrucomicrobiae bacterium]